MKQIELLTPNNFKDFELLDSGSGYRLERWNGVSISRPDPQAIWRRHLGAPIWAGVSATYHAGARGEKGRWEFKKQLPKDWQANFDGVKFLLKPTPFKHTGVFAEQAANWEWMKEKLKVENEKLKILNLFAYTGAATMVLTAAGCFVTHVDASKPAIGWAKENQAANKFGTNSIRWILDDCVKFVKREVRRGAKYDGILMDPPAFGHGPTGKVWKFNDNLPELLADSIKLLSPVARFLLVNGYATNSSALALGNVLEDNMRNLPGSIKSGELCLKQTDGRYLSCGIFARWSNFSSS